MVGELEITSLAADLGTEEQLRAVRLGEPRGVAVALDQGEPLVEQADLEIDPLLQRGLDGGDLAPGFADQEHLGRFVLGEKINQPVDARVFLERVADVFLLTGLLGLQLASDPGEQR